MAWAALSIWPGTALDPGLWLGPLCQTSSPGQQREAQLCSTPPPSQVLAAHCRSPPYQGSSNKTQLPGRRLSCRAGLGCRQVAGVVRRGTCSRGPRQGYTRNDRVTTTKNPPAASCSNLARPGRRARRRCTAVGSRLPKQSEDPSDNINESHLVRLGKAKTSLTLLSIPADEKHPATAAHGERASSVRSGTKASKSSCLILASKLGLSVPDKGSG